MKLFETFSTVDHFENAVFLLSCGWVKTELFGNAGVTASIYNPSVHALSDLWGSCDDIFLSAFEVRTSQRFHADGDIFKDAARVDADIVKTDKKDVFSQNIRILVEVAIKRQGFWSYRMSQKTFENVFVSN